MQYRTHTDQAPEWFCEPLHTHNFVFDADYDRGSRKVGALVCDLRLDIMLRVRVAAPM